MWKTIRVRKVQLICLFSGSCGCVESWVLIYHPDFFYRSIAQALTLCERFFLFTSSYTSWQIVPKGLSRSLCGFYICMYICIYVHFLCSSILKPLTNLAQAHILLARSWADQSRGCATAVLCRFATHHFQNKNGTRHIHTPTHTHTHTHTLAQSIFEHHRFFLDSDFCVEGHTLP